MANICIADYANGERCANCKWHRRDEERDFEYGGLKAYSCFAKADKYGYVKYEKEEE